ncbi:MAG TPA: carbohydrate kinase [Dongiaceae bacterium]|nr:carbohydrate kinase [Dongiaceae bacterium]
MQIAVAGEALIDFINTGPLAFQGHFGGSPFNTAIAAARLGAATGYLTQLSTDLFGEPLKSYLDANGVDTRFILRSDAPSTLAFVERAAGTNRYVFLAKNSADAGYAPNPLPDLPPETTFLQFGSVSLLNEPAATTIGGLVAKHYPRCIIGFDPNVRPSLIPDMAAYRARLTGWLGHTHLLKISDEDVALLAPGVSFQHCAEGWFELGVRAAVITRGGAGASLFRPGHQRLDVAAPQVIVADTVGAGDTFTAGLLTGLLDGGAKSPDDLATLPDEGWKRVLTFAATAAALNCTKIGCNPPQRAEVQAYLSA